MPTTLTDSRVRPRRGRTPTLGIVVLATILGLPALGAASAGDGELFVFPEGHAVEIRRNLPWDEDDDGPGGLPDQPGREKGELATLHHLLMRTLSEGPKGTRESITTTSYLGLEGDYLVTGTFAGVPVRIYTRGSQAGDAWPCTDPRWKSGPDRVFTHLGVEKVAVPAGIFMNARHVQVVIRAEGGFPTGDFHIVPGIGIVKTRAVSETAGRKQEVLLELESFTPPGEF